MQQLITCFKSSTPTQVGPYMLISLSIHLHSLHPDDQYGQTWHLSTQLRSGERLVVGFCGQPLYCNPPYYLTTRFWSPLSCVVSAQVFPDRPRPMPCKSAQMGSCPIIFLWLWPVTDHEPHSWHVPTNKIRRRSETAPWSGWWCSHMAVISSDQCTREMKWMNLVPSWWLTQWHYW